MLTEQGACGEGALQLLGKGLSGDLQGKLERLLRWFKSYKKAVVAFSGGVDSSTVATIAKLVLGHGALAVTSATATFSAQELSEAISVAKVIGVRHTVIKKEGFGDPRVAENQANRCYYCRGDLASDLKRIKEEEKAEVIVDGTIADDLKEHRPGIVALREAGVRSPLAEVGLTKSEVRTIARALAIPSADKPSNSCLASRFPYGQRITQEKLKRVDDAEIFIRGLLGAKQVRVRDHGDIARIELGREERRLLFDEKSMELIAEKLKSFGFKYVVLDLEGYRTGSMDEGLRTKVKPL